MAENEFRITVKLKDSATVTEEELCASTPLDANGNEEIFRLSDPNGR